MTTSNTFEQAEKFYNENKDRLIGEFLSEVDGSDLEYQAEYDQVIIFGLCCQNSDMNGNGRGTAHYDNDGADQGFDDLVDWIANDERTEPLIATEEFWSKEWARTFAHDLAKAIIERFEIESMFLCNQ